MSLVRKERLKLAATALNTLATASITVGALAPAAAFFYSLGAPSAVRPLWQLLLSGLIWVSMAARYMTGLRSFSGDCGHDLRVNLHAIRRPLPDRCGGLGDLPPRGPVGAVRPQGAVTSRPAKQVAAKPTLLAGGNPQIAKGVGDAPVQA